MRTNPALPENSEQRFDHFVDQLAAVIGHADRVQPMRDYCTGLLLPGERKSVEPMAARIEPRNVRSKHQSMHHFIAEAPWSDAAVLTRVYHYALPALCAHGGVESWIVDDTGFPKKGKHSVGVARQYCGQLGKTDNCQVAVSLSLANSVASLPIAFQLYLPKEWAADAQRRKRAGVPEEIRFCTKPEMALAQLRAAVAAGVPVGIVTADTSFGNDTDFRDGVSALGLRYALAVQESTTVWPKGQGPLPPPAPGPTGRPATRLRRDAQHQPVTVKQLALSLGQKKCRTVTWREGAQGLMQSQFCALRVRSAHRDYTRTEPREEEWLLIEWPVGKKEPTKYWLLTLSKKTPLRKLVYAAKLRWRIERDYEELKDEVGLGHYEGRGWRGFHHHASLCIAAYAFLVAERGLFPPGADRVRAQLRAAGVSQGYQRPGAARAAGAPQPDVDCDAAYTVNCGTDQAPTALPVLPPSTYQYTRSIWLS